MLIKQKIAVTLTALSLMSMVAIAPTAMAIPINENPDILVDNNYVDAGSIVTFDVDSVRAKCAVTTTLGSRKVVDKAVATESTDDAATIGEIVDATIRAPRVAGVYVVKSIVSKSCASDSGYRSSDDIFVGQPLYIGADDIDGDGSWDYDSASASNFATRIYGDVVDYDEYFDGDGEFIDLGTVKLQFYKGNKLIASTTTDSDGYFSVVLPSKSFKTSGEHDITVKLSGNRDYYMEMDSDVNVFTVDVQDPAVL
jgi:hypothetical protein